MTTDGRVAIVTGGGQGLGFAVAEALASGGVRLILTGRSQAKLDAAAARLDTDVLAVAGDAGERATAERTVAAALDRFGRADILVNNAQTIFPQTPLIEQDDAMLEASIRSGLFGTIYFMQAAYPALRESRGAIVNVGSMNGTAGIAGSAGYAAAKEGIRAVTRVAAREWGKDGIRVNVICPGARTEPVIAFFEQQPELESVFLAQASLGRLAEPADVGRTVAWLSGPDCFLTGQTIHVDGGQIMP